ncbi:MAG: hypothetical protein AB1401_00750 [Thermodesulfobacteriota bacterium]
MRYITILVIILNLLGCSTLNSRIVVSYKKAIETQKLDHVKLAFNIQDLREDKEIFGSDFKKTYDASRFDVITVLQGKPEVDVDKNLSRLFYNAFEDRLQGFDIVGKDQNPSLLFNISILIFKLDFKKGHWIGDVIYDVKIFKEKEMLIDKRIRGYSTKLNVWGYRSGEASISEAFSNAINSLELNLIK